MKRNWKRMVALGLMTAMTLSLGACGKGSNDGTETEKSTESTSTEIKSTESTSSETVESNIEDVTLTVYLPGSGENSMTGGIQDDAVQAYIKEKTGVTLDITLLDTNKTSAMVASGDLYDLNVFDNLTYVEPLIKSGALASIDDYLQYAPELTDNFPGLLEYSKSKLSAGEGKTYILPARAKEVGSPVATSQDGNFIRWDYYVEAGSPELNSVDDYLNLLESIQKNHPETEDGKKVYGLTTYVGGVYALRAYSPLRKYIGNQLVGSFDSYTLNDMAYHDLYDDMNSYWTQADLFFQANQRGLLDPESFTQKHENVMQKLMEGRLICAPYQWQIASVNATLASETNGSAAYLDIPFVDTEEWPAWVDRSSPYGYTARMFFISSKCDETKMKAIMRLFNLVYSEEGSRIIMNGVPDTNWTTDSDGNATFTADAQEAMKTDATYAGSQGMNKYLGIIGRDYDALSSNGQFLDLKLNIDYVKGNLSKAEQEYCEFYGAETPLEVLTERVNKTSINLGYDALMPTDIPTDISRAVTKIENYIIQEYPNLVMSESQEAYDAKLAEIRAELTKLGYDDVRDYYKAAFDTSISEYDSSTK